MYGSPPQVLTPYTPGISSASVSSSQSRPQSLNPGTPESQVTYSTPSPLRMSLTWTAQSQSVRQSHSDSHNASSRPQTAPQSSVPFSCGYPGCKQFTTRKDLERHLKTAAIHSETSHVWRCRCGRQCTRKDNFRDHLKKNACTAGPSPNYKCACGSFSIDSRLPNAISVFRNHFEPCGRRQRGRRKKPRNS
ncbi:hypothetical protein GGR57DRAFT_184707 [Xylariaceae sp. FL1272]|nr:hypothetical protein GGR57DRAFT_184707 [Xylariaceae sp. FL1272]